MDHPIRFWGSAHPDPGSTWLHGWAFDNIYLTIADVKISEVIRQIGSWILWSKMMAWRIPPKKIMPGTWKFNPFFSEKENTSEPTTIFGFHVDWRWFVWNSNRDESINVWKPGAGAWSLKMAFIYLGASRRWQVKSLDKMSAASDIGKTLLRKSHHNVTYWEWNVLVDDQYLCTHSVHFWTYFTPCYWKARLHLTNLESRHANWLQLREGTPYIRDEAYMQAWDTCNLWKMCLGTPVFQKKHPKWLSAHTHLSTIPVVSSTCKILQKYTTT